MSYPFPNFTGHHHILIANILKLSNCQKFLELGIFDGLLTSHASKFIKKCVGVDISDEKIINKNFEFYKMTTTDFFKQNKETFDVIFIDADHSFESVKKDFESSLKILNKHGLIFLHDTDPVSKKYLQNKYCSDCYKIIDYIKTNHKELNLINLPITEAGLTIVQRNNESRVSSYL